MANILIIDDVASFPKLGEVVQCFGHEAVRSHPGNGLQRARAGDFDVFFLSAMPTQRP
jgi:hypothetical protein